MTFIEKLDIGTQLTLDAIWKEWVQACIEQNKTYTEQTEITTYTEQKTGYTLP
mgnify:CR=1 FL=1